MYFGRDISWFSKNVKTVKESNYINSLFVMRPPTAYYRYKFKANLGTVSIFSRRQRTVAKVIFTALWSAIWNWSENNRQRLLNYGEMDKNIFWLHWQMSFSVERQPHNMNVLEKSTGGERVLLLCTRWCFKSYANFRSYFSEIWTQFYNFFFVIYELNHFDSSILIYFSRSYTIYM